MNVAPGSRPWVLISGGVKRLGAACAVSAAQAGFNVAAHHRDPGAPLSEAREAIEAAGGRAAFVQADLADPAAAQALVSEAANAAGGPIHALVNAAAIFEHDLLETLSVDLLERHMRINALAPALLMRELAAQLPQGARGSVVNFLDFKLAQPYPDHFSYSLSKYALMGATELAARGLAPRIRVNAVAPGYVLPAPGQPQEDFERLHAQTPLARGATAADVATAVVFLLTNEAVSGQTIYVDAGLRFESHERDFSFR